jgi:hypothetical protein
MSTELKERAIWPGRFISRRWMRLLCRGRRSGRERQAAGVGLELCAAGMAHEDVVLPYVRRILDCYASQDVPGLFADELELPDAPGSVVTLVSLFDAAVAANRLLTRQ